MVDFERNEQRELQGRLISCVENNDIEGVRRARDGGAHPNGDKHDGRPLILASECGYVDIVKELIHLREDKYGYKWEANINVKGGTPLRMAADNGHVEVVKTLLHGPLQGEETMNIEGYHPQGWDRKKRADVGASNMHAIKLAIDRGHMEIMVILIGEAIKKGENLYNMKEDPLVTAVKNNDYETTEKLLNPQDPNIPSKSPMVQGGIALEIAKEEGNIDIQNLLRRYGA